MNAVCGGEGIAARISIVTREFTKQFIVTLERSFGVDDFMLQFCKTWLTSDLVFLSSFHAEGIKCESISRTQFIRIS